jgi:hypothetical protein
MMNTMMVMVTVVTFMENTVLIYQFSEFIYLIASWCGRTSEAVDGLPGCLIRHDLPMPRLPYPFSLMNPASRSAFAKHRA